MSNISGGGDVAVTVTIVGVDALQPPTVFIGDGYTTTFTLPGIPTKIVGVFLNGQLLIDPDDYTVIGAAIAPTLLLQGGASPDKMEVLWAM